METDLPSAPGPCSPRGKPQQEHPALPALPDALSHFASFITAASITFLCWEPLDFLPPQSVNLLMTSCSQVAITMGLARVVSTANFLGEDVFINLLKLSGNLVTNSTTCTQAASMGLLEQPNLRTGKGNGCTRP